MICNTAFPISGVFVLRANSNWNGAEQCLRVGLFVRLLAFPEGRHLSACKMRRRNWPSQQRSFLAIYELVSACFIIEKRKKDFSFPPIHYYVPSTRFQIKNNNFGIIYKVGKGGGGITNIMNCKCGSVDLLTCFLRDIIKFFEGSILKTVIFSDSNSFFLRTVNL